MCKGGHPYSPKTQSGRQPHNQDGRRDTWRRGGHKKSGRQFSPFASTVRIYTLSGSRVPAKGAKAETKFSPPAEGGQYATR